MKRALFSLLLAVFIFGAGCDSGSDYTAGPASAEQEETVIDLDSPTGGFSLSDEEPAFGEADLYTYSKDEKVYDDEINNDPVMERYRNRNRKGVKRFRLRAIWGRLPSYQDSSSADCYGLDWSGSLTFNRGIVVIEKLIAFEPGDYITRKDRSTIEWVSNTCPHVDGIQVRLIAPPAFADCDSVNTDSTRIAEPALTISTGPYTKSFTLEELEALELIEPVDRCCNGIALNSYIRYPGCPTGHLLGKWKSIEPDTIPSDSTSSGGTEKILLGYFRGVWLGENGRIGGYLKGAYGQNSSGESVFFGKYIDFKGRFKGLLKGYYEVSPVDTFAYSPPRGIFRGRWFNRNLTPQGSLKGDWVTDTEGNGFFHGRWIKNCLDNL